jgi:hypothetical protein
MGGRLLSLRSLLEYSFRNCANKRRYLVAYCELQGYSFRNCANKTKIPSCILRIARLGLLLLVISGVTQPTWNVHSRLTQPASCSLACFGFLFAHRDGDYVSRKLRLTSKGLHGITSQKIALSLTSLDIFSVWGSV